MIKKEWHVPLSLQGTIIDIETTALDPSDGELITFGVFYNDLIIVFQRTDTSEAGRELFEKYLSNWTDFCPKPYYAYNKGFEEKWLNTKIQYDLMAKWKEGAEKIKTENGTLKWPRLNELVSFPHKYYGIEEIDGRGVLLLWKEYVLTGDKEKLNAIINHNLNNLASSACLCLWDKLSPRLFQEIDKNLSE